MTDLVERLRELAIFDKDDANEAADEVERLRNILLRIDTFIGAISPKPTKELVSIRSEIRAALGGRI